MEHNCSNSTSINMSLSDFLDSLQQQTTLVMIPSFCFLAMLAVIGLVGNSLILLVYSRRFKSNPTNVLLMTIAAIDLVANVGAIPVDIHSVLNFWDYDNLYLCKGKAFLNSFTTIGGAAMLLAVAVIRYRKICAPHGWQVNSRQAKLTSLIVVILTVLLSIPSVILYGPRSKPTPCEKIQGYECYNADKYKGSVLLKLNNGLYFMLYFSMAIPLTVLYVLIGIQAHKRTRKLKVNNPSNLHETNPAPPAISHAKEKQSLELNPSTATSESSNGYIPNSDIETAESSCSSGLCRYESKCGLDDKDKDGHTLDFRSAIALRKEFVTQTQREVDADLSHACQKSSDTDNTSLSKNINIQNKHNYPSINDSPNYYNNEKDGINQRSSKRNKFLMLFTAKTRLSKTSKLVSNRTKRRSSSRITVMLTIITSMFLISYLVFLVLSLYRNFLPRHYESRSRAEMTVFQLFFRLFFLNCAANCIIYGLCDPNFRRECLRVVRCRSRIPQL